MHLITEDPMLHIDTHTHNINSADCLVKKQNLTETTVTNICTSKVTSVPHGTVEIIGVGLLFCLLAYAVCATYITIRNIKKFYG